MERAEGSGGGGASLDAALVQEPECAMFTFYMNIKEEVRLNEEPECSSSAGCASETGEGACAGAARVGRDQLDLAPARGQHQPYIRGVSRPLESDGEACPKRGGVPPRPPAGVPPRPPAGVPPRPPAGAATARAQHDTAQHDTISDTLQHTAQTTYKCNTCSQIFLQKQCLIDHVQVHLREGSETLPNESLFIFEPHLKKYTCKICKRMFRKDYLKVHARFHTGEKPYACEVCKKQFAVLDSLKVHKRIHTEERPFSCNICAKSFARRSGLKSHKLSHTGDKPFSCEICKRGFARAGTLKSHIRTHTGEQPYGCIICKKRFTQWSALKSHKRTHAGAEPYSPPLVQNYSPALDRCADTAHREPAGTTSAELETAQYNIFTDTLHHTAETHTYKCDTCGHTFLQKQCLIDHVEVHLRERSETLPNESFFIFEPSDTDTSVKKYSCKICKKKFQKNYLKIHARLHTGEKPYACEVCKKQFAVLGKLREHKLVHTEGRPYSCDLCAKSFARLSYLKAHKLSHTGETPYSCKICKKRFGRKCNLKAHERIHSGEKPYVCTICKKRFTQWRPLEMHKRTHAGANPYSCEEKDALGHTQRPNAVNALGENSRFVVYDEPARSTGAEHETEQHNTFTDTLHHTAETHTYKCNTCGLIFLQKQCLIDHVQVHLREESETLPNESLFIFEPHLKKYTCKICKKKFRKDYLKIHVRFHTGEKPYACEVCKKQFAVLGNLREHKRIHTEEKAYSCDLCAKSFTRSSYLKIHERSHTGEKPYKCETCKKRFSQLPNLQSHIRTHTGEKPYACTMCDKQFRQWSSLNNHKRSHTVKNRYSCETNKNAFQQPGALNVHKISHTNEKPFSCEHKQEAVSVKEKPGCESMELWCASETHKETRVKEEPKCESSADSCGVSETGATVDYVIKAELELGPEGVQRRDIPIAPRENSRFVVYDEPARSTGAEHETEQHNTFTDTLHHTAETHTYKCNTCGQIFLQKQCLIDHVQVHLREESETLPNESLFIFEPHLKKYACKICKKKFRKDYLKIHARFHTGEKPYACEVCKKQFAVLGNLREHKRIHTEEKAYSCDLCGKGFARSSYLKIHERSHTGEKPYKCETCKKRFSQLPNLQSHIRTHTGEKPYACTMCEKQFRQWSSLNNHKRSHTVKNRYSCETNKKAFQQPGALNVHKISHTNEKPFSCEYKQEAVSVKEKYECESMELWCASETHKETRVKEEPKCESSADSCGVSETGTTVDYVIKAELELGPEGVQRRDIPIAPREKSRFLVYDEPTGSTGAEHETEQHNSFTDNLHHTAETHTYKCNTCGQNFLQKQRLIDHVKVHLREESETLPNESSILEPSDTCTSVEKYPCKICKKKFRKNYLKIHARFHTGEKPYACEVCKKQFAVLGNLREHKRIHTEEKVYSCDLCAKSFTRSSYLKIHERSHTGEKPYKCETCNKRFSQLPNLQSHKRTHTGEKPYACTMCDKQFRQRSPLNIHKRSHTVKNRYSCETSKKAFQQPGALNVHKISHTNEKSFSCEHKHEAVSVKEKPECESMELWCASETHKETRVKEEPKCESSADSCGVSETGATVDYVIKAELELGPEGVQRRDIPIAPRAASPRCSLLAAASGAAGAQQRAPPQEPDAAHGAPRATPAGTHVIKQSNLTSDKQSTSKRPYICDICKKTFTQSGSLNTHKRIHTGEKPYSCEVCNKAFTALATFNNHKITAHSHVKPYACEICNKAFKLLASLKSHGRIHTQGKPFSCDICKRQFRHESALRVHNRIHTGVKPYSCPMCKQQFSQNAGMKAHIIHMHTREKPFCCEICNRQFATKGNLKYHIGTHSKDEY